MSALTHDSAGMCPPPQDPSWSGMGLTEKHVTMLTAAAVTSQTAASNGVYSITSVEDLPEEFRFYGRDAVPGICFTWTSPTGRTMRQIRPDVPVLRDGDETPRKYLFPQGCGSVLGTIREVEGATTALIVEGTKQSLAAASYAPADMSVYAVAGCSNWSTDGNPISDLMVFEDMNVVVIFDADFATKTNVWEAAERLGRALKQDGAVTVKYAALVAGANTGLDDLLGQRPEEKREAFVKRLIDNASAKLPKKPPSKKAPGGSTPTGDGRPMILVNEDRNVVIEAITSTLVNRCDRDTLFNYGQVISQRKGVEMKQVSKDVFARVLATAALTGKMGPNGDFTPAWPESQTLEAALTEADRYSTLDKLSRVPFVRPDGSVCQTPGYDEDTATFLVLDDSLGRVDVPEAPTEGQVAQAVRFLRDEWLVDFFRSMPTDADKANCLGLILTPLIRGLVPLVPMAIINGKQAGVGKNKLTDLVAIVATGLHAEPLPYARDDDESRKVITSTFRSGADVFAFDEAHVIEGPSMARALTSTTWKDRVLGGSNMASYPNRVTWIAMGNQVVVNGDMSRRVYQIALRSEEDDPTSRPESWYTHPDIEGWTIEHRSEIVTALLTLVRAWYVAGKPAGPAVPFGSFEQWAKIIGGVLHNAGIPGFLSTLIEWRSETDTERMFWEHHLDWLRRTFRDKEFVASEVTKALRLDPLTSEAPPGMRVSPDDTNYTRNLGMAYNRMRERKFGGQGLEIVQRVKSTGHAARWAVITHSDESSPETSPRFAAEATGATAPTPQHTENIFYKEDHLGDKSVTRVGAGDQTPPPVAPVASTTLSNRRRVSCDESYTESNRGYAAPVMAHTPWTPEPNPARSPSSSLLHLTSEVRTPVCQQCRKDKHLVPPAMTWFACPSCFPATFTHE